MGLRVVYGSPSIIAPADNDHKKNYKKHNTTYTSTKCIRAHAQFIFFWKICFSNFPDFFWNFRIQNKYFFLGPMGGFQVCKFFLNFQIPFFRGPEKIKGYDFFQIRRTFFVMEYFFPPQNFPPIRTRLIFHFCVPGFKRKN